LLFNTLIRKVTALLLMAMLGGILHPDWKLEHLLERATMLYSWEICLLNLPNRNF